MSIPKFQKVALCKQPAESPDAIEYAEVETPQITGPHDVIVRNKYGGVNFIDVYYRKGIYPVEYPNIFGREGSGVIAAVGDDVTDYKVGEKVAYLGWESFAPYTKLPDDHVHIKKLPADSTDEDLKTWAASLLQGLTAITLPIESYEVKKNDFILVWAAAGGVGQILTKYTASLGANVIAVASTDEKLEIAKKAGAQFLIKSGDDVAARVSEITNGEGVRAVFDSIGKDTFETSFAALGIKGTFVTYGNSSGVIPPTSFDLLTPKNLKVARPQVYNSVRTKPEWEFYTDVLKEAFENKTIDISIYKTYPLSEYKQATEDLESRKAIGKLILEIP
ncbi:hypothetical protein JCM33374_g1325 [Metschnikowia sp. JCM 33374]|nr:hypothetical protein JCM33374_g1325 [Metschnikowia sp. JCM 33374]